MTEALSPITNEEKLQLALEYIAGNSVTLAQLVLQQKLTIDTICFFSHSADEYAFLEKAVSALGPVSKFSHGLTLYVDTDFIVKDQRIWILGVRQPDTERPQIGYSDFPVDNYKAIRATNNPYIKEIISGRGENLLEIRHPDFDVLGYIIDKEKHHDR